MMITFMGFALRRQHAFPPRSVRGSCAGLTTGRVGSPEPKKAAAP